MLSPGIVLKQIGFSDALCKCADGNLGVPLPSYTGPAEWYGHPPALIPILSSGSGPIYMGVWKHWFAARPPSFVKMDVEANRNVTEIARTERQFFGYLLLQAICIEDGVSPDIASLAEAVPALNLEAINAISLETGDDPIGLRALEENAEDYPALYAMPESYTGAFPMGRKNLETTCSFELSTAMLESIQYDLDVPPWLQTSEQPAMFDGLMADGDFQGAWLSLNSSGWTFSEAVAALGRMCRETTDRVFLDIASAWMASVAADACSTDRY